MSQIKPEQIRWRVGSTSKDKSKGMLLGYIDARTAMELLDELDAEWSDEYREVAINGDKGIECRLTVKSITRSDVGVPSNTEGLKGAYSDALKRAAVKHGIGRELYELPRIWVALDNYGRPTAEPAFVKGRWTLPSGSGNVFYDHAPTDTPQDSRPAAAGAGGVSSPASSVPEMPEFPPPLDEEPTFDDVLAATGGVEVKPTEIQERIERARAKGAQAQAPKECPVHHKAKARGKGLFCPTPVTKNSDGSVAEWCDWSAAA